MSGSLKKTIAVFLLFTYLGNIVFGDFLLLKTSAFAKQSKNVWSILDWHERDKNIKRHVVENKFKKDADLKVSQVDITRKLPYDIIISEKDGISSAIAIKAVGIPDGELPPETIINSVNILAEQLRKDYDNLPETYSKYQNLNLEVRVPQNYLKTIEKEVFSSLVKNLWEKHKINLHLEELNGEEVYFEEAEEDLLRDERILKLTESFNSWDHLKEEAVKDLKETELIQPILSPGDITVNFIRKNLLGQNGKKNSTIQTMSLFPGQTVTDFSKKSFIGNNEELAKSVKEISSGMANADKVFKYAQLLTANIKVHSDLPEATVWKIQLAVEIIGDMSKFGLAYYEKIHYS